MESNPKAFLAAKKYDVTALACTRDHPLALGAGLKMEDFCSSRAARPSREWRRCGIRSDRLQEVCRDPARLPYSLGLSRAVEVAAFENTRIL
jgi:hypothetical protein